MSDRERRAPSPVFSDLGNGSGEPNTSEFIRILQGMVAGLTLAIWLLPKTVQVRCYRCSG